METRVAAEILADLETPAEVRTRAGVEVLAAVEVQEVAEVPVAVAVLEDRVVAEGEAARVAVQAATRKGAAVKALAALDRVRLRRQCCRV